MIYIIYQILVYAIQKKSSREIGKVRGWDIVTVLDVSFNYTNGSLMEERMYIIKISGEKIPSIRKKKCKDYKNSGLNFKVVRVADT